MKKIIIGILIFIEIILISIIIVLSLYKKGLLFDTPVPIIKNVYIDDNNYVNIDVEIEKNGINDQTYYLIKKDSSTHQLIQIIGK